MSEAERAGMLDKVVDFRSLFAAIPTPYVVMTPDLVIVEANDAYLASTGRRRGDLVGQPLLAAFPADPDSLDGDGVSPIQLSLQRVRETGRPERMPVQKYDIVDADADGELSERYWLLVHAPMLDDEGRTGLLIQRAEDVTDFMRERESGRPAVESGERWRRRVEEVEADLFARAQELAAALEAKDLAAGRLASLAEVALALTAVETVEDLERMVVGRGLSVLGADGGAVVSAGADGGWRITMNAALGERAQLIYGDMPVDSPLPGCSTARTGERLLLPTRASGLAFEPAMASVYRETQRDGWAFLPLTVQDENLGCLAVCWIDEHRFRPDELDLLDALAAQCAQALHRIRAADVQRVAALQVQRLAEALQQALLTPPPEPDHLHVVVRYRPAAHEAQVGGDWYDAFATSGGSMTLVVGDVAGHDRHAAAAMAQVRNVLRGVGQCVEGSPSAVLSALDAALSRLQVPAMATAVLCQVRPGPRSSGVGASTLRWSNAGHPPPLLLQPDGTASLLGREPELLLGVAPDEPRSDHEVTLLPGSTVVLYTDGLVERRDQSLDEGMERLRTAAGDLHALPPDELCDELLTRLAADAEDDVALLVMRLTG